MCLLASSAQMMRAIFCWRVASATTFKGPSRQQLREPRVVKQGCAWVLQHCMSAMTRFRRK
jgi:hypothetical protein